MSSNASTLDARRDVSDERLLVRRMRWPADDRAGSDPLLTREWLVTNGLGGYASGTVSGVITRRYHGLLVAALPAPHGRTVMLHHVADTLKLPDGRRVALGGEERAGAAPALDGAEFLREFRLEMGLPVWRFAAHGFVLERRLLLPYGQNTAHVTYRLLEGPGRVRLDLQPSMHFRHHEDPVSTPLADPYTLQVVDDCFEVTAGDLPPLRLLLCAGTGHLVVRPQRVHQLLFRMEQSRGYDAEGDLWTPGAFRIVLEPGERATLVASTETWDTVRAMSPDTAEHAERQRRQTLLAGAPEAARDGVGAELVLAADHFIITPAGRAEDAARARAEGDDVRTVIAGYHWFTDWGRDTMISLEGLTLSTGRHLEASYILRTFGHYVRDGLIPNMFPDGRNEGLYHTADATLWYFHAIDRYVAVSGDETTRRRLMPVLRDIVDHHVRGTRFGIGIDPDDGLLRQGEEGYQLTWMDAKVDGWVVTPRRGKAVEINALWYNALRLMEGWLAADGEPEAAAEMASLATRVREAFNARFWYADGGYLYDVVDGDAGDDPACRPNQVLAIALRHAVLEEARWKPMLHVVQARLLTGVGLRSLAPGHPDYRPTYHGDLRTRDAAYHQGTVWGWLVGPMVNAWLRVHPDDRAGARRMLEGFVEHLGEACIGSISEIFDAEPPFTARGCVAQAWSVAEVLRCWLLTDPGAGREVAGH